MPGLTLVAALALIGGLWPMVTAILKASLDDDDSGPSRAPDSRAALLENRLATKRASARRSPINKRLGLCSDGSRHEANGRHKQ
jgi:hypothetical protein